MLDKEYVDEGMKIVRAERFLHVDMSDSKSASRKRKGGADDAHYDATADRADGQQEEEEEEDSEAEEARATHASKAAAQRMKLSAAEVKPRLDCICILLFKK